ncbi:MAG: hypothetical protein ICV66_01085 [Chitinophagaceae bacterium]|nr:hypothetical protein [Chitinophagaceae bacterium]
MHVAVLCSDNVRKDELFKGHDVDIQWVSNFEKFKSVEADAYLDLDFEINKSRIESLKLLLPKTVIIHSVDYTLSEINAPFIRINAWPTFLQLSVIEATSTDENMKMNTEKIFHCFNKKIEWLPDVPGFVTARVISMIINEAYFSLADGVSTKAEIDTAMKLGTNYPFGPFEWCKKIGIEKIVSLLTKLSTQQSRYTPCELLIKESAISK